MLPKPSRTKCQNTQPSVLPDGARRVCWWRPDRSAAVCRELTKRFEECREGSLAGLAESYAETTPKGEIVVLIGKGNSEDISESDLDHSLSEALLVNATLTELVPKQPHAAPENYC